MDLTVIRILIDLFKTQNSNVLAILLVIMLYNTYRFSKFLYEEIKKRDKRIEELEIKIKEIENDGAQGTITDTEKFARGIVGVSAKKTF